MFDTYQRIGVSQKDIPNTGTTISKFEERDFFLDMEIDKMKQQVSFQIFIQYSYIDDKIFPITEEWMPCLVHDFLPHGN